VVVAGLLTVTGEDTARRWWVVWGCCISLSCDGSLECPDLVKYFPRDLTNDAAIVDDRFNKLTEGIFIVCDFLRVGGAEVTWRGLNISWKVLNTDVDTLGGGSSIGTFESDGGGRRGMVTGGSGLTGAKTPNSFPGSLRHV